MCIFAAATNFHDDFEFMLLFNRDEFYARSSSPPTRVRRLDATLFYPLDHVGGGTWIGWNGSKQRIVALTNVRSEPPLRKNGGDIIKSRGELVIHALCSESNNDTVFEDAYYNYHLLQTDLVRNSNQISMKLVTCAPPSDSPETVEYMVDSSSDRKPWVATKSNDHGNGLTTAETKLENENTWPKAIWLRNQVETILSQNCNNRKESGLDGAKALVKQLEPCMNATTMDDASNKQVANAIPSKYNPLPIHKERILSKAPFIMPFLILDDDDQWYGTVSQSVLLYSKSEECLYWAFRDTRQTTTASLGHSEQAATPSLPNWTWERISVPEEDQL